MAATITGTFVLSDIDYPSNHQGLVRVQYDVLDNGSVIATCTARRFSGEEYVSSVRVETIEEARESWVRLRNRKNCKFVRTK